MKNVYVELRGNDDGPECNCPGAMNVNLSNIYMDSDEEPLEDAYERQNRHKEMTDACQELMKDDDIRKLVSKVLGEHVNPCLPLPANQRKRHGVAKNMATQTEDVDKGTEDDGKAKVLAEKTEPNKDEAKGEELAE